MQRDEAQKLFQASEARAVKQAGQHNPIPRPVRKAAAVVRRHLPRRGRFRAAVREVSLAAKPTPYQRTAEAAKFGGVDAEALPAISREQESPPEATQSDSGSPNASHDPQQQPVSNRRSTTDPSTGIVEAFAGGGGNHAETLYQQYWQAIQQGKPLPGGVDGLLEQMIAKGRDAGLIRSIEDIRSLAKVDTPEEAARAMNSLAARQQPADEPATATEANQPRDAEGDAAAVVQAESGRELEQQQVWDDWIAERRAKRAESGGELEPEPGEAPEPETTPTLDTTTRTAPRVTLSESDRQILTMRAVDASKDRNTFHRFIALSGGIHPDTKERFDVEAERSAAMERKGVDDAAAITEADAAGFDPASQTKQPEQRKPTRRETALDAAQLAGDVAGIADQSGVVDGINAVVSLGRAATEPGRRKEHLKNAAISGVGMIPIVGDIPKLAKLKSAKRVAEAAKTHRSESRADQATSRLSGMMGGDGSDGRDGINGTAGNSGQDGESIEAANGRNGSAGSGTDGRDGIDGAAGGGGDGGDIPPAVGPPSPGDRDRGPRELEDEIHGKRKLNEKTKDWIERILEATVAISGMTVAFGGLFEGLRLVNKGIVTYHKHLSDVNGEIAIAMAKREIAGVRRDMREGATMADSVAEAAQAETRLEDLRESVTSPIKAMFTDLQATAGNLTGKALELADEAAGVSKKLQALASVTDLLTDQLQSKGEQFMEWLASLLGIDLDDDDPTNTAWTAFLSDVTTGKFEADRKAAKAQAEIDRRNRRNRP